MWPRWRDGESPYEEEDFIYCNRNKSGGCDGSLQIFYLSTGDSSNRCRFLISYQGKAVSKDEILPTVVAKFFDALKARDADALRPFLSPSVKTVLPLNESGQAKPADRQFSGVEETVAFYKGAIGRIASPLIFTDSEITVSPNGRRIFVESVGDMKSATGSPYRNIYVWRFDIDKDRIVAIREYSNPVTTALTFGRPLGPRPN